MSSGSSIDRKFGEKLFLKFLSSDGDENKRVFVSLLLPDNSLFKPILELSNVGGGLYTEESEIMPQLPVLIAKFDVFEQDGTTDSGYEEVFDTYYLDTDSNTANNNSSQETGKFVAVIKKNITKASYKSNSTKTVLKYNKTSAIIKKGFKLRSEIKINKLIGVIKCKK